eukprot:CAMPEP_0183427730 /NCGR_PEP_ID=MMETSP0370-20130417/43417_1 /TAXON_ID=268820 /ORGANISM="Peridinium aciculiferum, Strain PAER-2" /LENGTH=138 /DNA_ID=CAMNT_0025612357 /DNA_START=56 /DNA_END=472 /DNA_ORIENTATION=-
MAGASRRRSRGLLARLAAASAMCLAARSLTFLGPPQQRVDLSVPASTALAAALFASAPAWATIAELGEENSPETREKMTQAEQAESMFGMAFIFTVVVIGVPATMGLMGSNAKNMPGNEFMKAEDYGSANDMDEGFNR